jgi:hypothetical protein
MAAARHGERAPAVTLYAAEEAKRRASGRASGLSRRLQKQPRQPRARPSARPAHGVSRTSYIK